jgi:hypothetical protein
MATRASSQAEVRILIRHIGEGGHSFFGDFGHVMLEVRDGARTAVFDYYSKAGKSIVGSQFDPVERAAAHEVTIPITHEQAQAMMDRIAEVKAQPPEYHVASNTCVTQSLKVLAAGGVVFADGQHYKWPSSVEAAAKQYAEQIDARGGEGVLTLPTTVIHGDPPQPHHQQADLPPHAGGAGGDAEPRQGADAEPQQGADAKPNGEGPTGAITSGPRDSGATAEGAKAAEPVAAKVPFDSSVQHKDSANAPVTGEHQSGGPPVAAYSPDASVSRDGAGQGPHQAGHHANAPVHVQHGPTASSARPPATLDVNYNSSQAQNGQPGGNHDGTGANPHPGEQPQAPTASNQNGTTDHNSATATNKVAIDHAHDYDYHASEAHGSA